MGSNITSVPTSAIQTNLGITSDNNYGPKTTAAVQQFQTANNLKADGIFGPKTLEAYDNKFNGGSSIVSTNDVHTQATADSAALDAALGRYDANYTAPVTDANGKVTPGTTSASSTETDPANPTDPTIAPVTKDPILSDTISGTSADPVIQNLDQIAATSNSSAKALIGNIKNTLQSNINDTNAQYNNYKAGLKLLGIETNSAEVTPDILASQINQASSDQMSKINTLQTAEVKALSDAELARENGDYKTLNEKMTYIKDIQNQKATALKDYQTGIANQNKEIKTQGDAQAKSIALDVYTSMQTLDPADQEKFLLGISNKLNIPLTSLVPALGPAKTTYDKAQAADVLTPAEDKELQVPYGTTKEQAAKLHITPKATTKASASTDAKPFKFTNTDTGKLADVGLTPSDLTKLETDISKYGADKVLANSKSGLTAAQTALITKILNRSKTTSTTPQAP